MLEAHPGYQFSQRELLKRLKIQTAKRKNFRQILNSLVEKEKRVQLRGNKYSISQKNRSVQGRLSITQKGFGFLITETDQPDIFIGRRNIRDAIDGDIVLVRVRNGSKRDRPRGFVIDVLERKTDRFIGTVVHKGKSDWLTITPFTPERKILIQKAKSIDYRDGQIVVADVINWGTSVNPILVKVFKVIGDGADAGNDFHIILEKHGYTVDFPQNVEKSARNCSVDFIKKETPHRRDLRSVQSFTIDPESAQDFDDALSIEETGNGIKLGVHIADVSHFVTRGSPLDLEAFKRGNSVYFSEGVVHMIPETLSGDLCSLKPDEDRLAMTALIDLDKDWNVTRFDVFPSVIRSCFRFTYKRVQEILDEEKTHSLKDKIKQLEKLSKNLFKKRREMGSIDFDIPEPIFSIGKEGIPHEIRPSERLQSHRIVEECMLLANRLVAERYGIINGKPVPFVYRTHKKPKSEDITSFLLLLKRIGFSLQKKHDPHTSRGMRDILEDVEDSAYKGLIESVALRAMSKANYSVDRRGHFGLAFQNYTHFTSPIRRYPDLLVHRRIKDILEKKIVKTQHLMEFLHSALDQANQMELKALNAEREYIKIKQFRWLNERIGDSFNGIISGVTHFGIFVELEESLAEGLVHIDSFEDDDYSFDEDNYCLRGRKSKKEYRLGDEVVVGVLDVIIERQRANFTIES